MGIILLAALLPLEGFFFVWALRSKDLRRKEKSIARLALLGLFAALCVTGVLEWGFRYYGIAVALVIQSVLAALALRPAKPKAYSVGKAVFTFLGGAFIYAFALLPAIIFPQFAPVRPTGSLTVETAAFVWTDESRAETFSTDGGKRFINALFYYPKERGRYPLVVFSHGAFGYNGSNQSAYENLASNGYVVASIGHPYHAFYTENPEGEAVIADMDFIGSVYEANNMDDGPEQQAIIDTWLDVRVPDMNFAIERIIELQNTNPADELFCKIDLDKIGLFGHSMGGAASAALGRQRNDIDAVIDLDGSMLGEILGYENGKPVFIDEPYPVPLLNVYAQDHYEASLALGGGGEYVNSHVEANAKEAYRFVLEGSGHMNFTDLPLFSPLLASLAGSGVSLSGTGTIDGREGIETVNRVVLEFFDYALKDGKFEGYTQTNRR